MVHSGMEQCHVLTDGQVHHHIAGNTELDVGVGVVAVLQKILGKQDHPALMRSMLWI